MKVSELFEAVELKEIGLDEVKIEDLGDGKFKVSVGPSSGPHVSLIRSILYTLTATPSLFPELKSKSGQDLTNRFLMSFKANGFTVKPKSEDSLRHKIEMAVNKFNRELKSTAKWKEAAPVRKKEAAARSSEEQKVRMAAMDAKYGKGTYSRVKIRQVGGDDGYQYNVFVDGRSVMNGLSKASAESIATKQRTELAKKNKLGQFAD